MSRELERIVKLEGQVERIRTDLDEEVLIRKQTEKALHEIATDKARVITGAWVANGLTCIFVACVMWLGQRAFAAEAAVFKQKLIEEVRSASGKVP